MSTWMIFRTIVRRHELTDCFDAAPMAPLETSAQFRAAVPVSEGIKAARSSGRFPPNMRAMLNSEPLPQHQTPVRAVTGHITFSTQDRVLQGNCIETPARLKRAIQLGTLHHITSPRTYS